MLGMRYRERSTALVVPIKPAVAQTQRSTGDALENAIPENVQIGVELTLGTSADPGAASEKTAS